MAHRLGTVFPDLLDLLLERDATTLRRVAGAAATWAASMAPSDDPRITAGLLRLASRHSDATTRRAVDRYVEEMDEHIWRADESGSLPDDVRQQMWAQARAGSSLSFALAVDHVEAAMESVYEASHVAPEIQEQLHATVLQALRASD